MVIFDCSAGGYNISTDQRMSIYFEQWIDESLVLLGVTYGPTGSEYIGRYIRGIRYDVVTDDIRIILNDNLCMKI